MFAMRIEAVRSFGRRHFIAISLRRRNRTRYITRGRGDGAR